MWNDVALRALEPRKQQAFRPTPGRCESRRQTECRHPSVQGVLSSGRPEVLAAGHRPARPPRLFRSVAFRVVRCLALTLPVLAALAMMSPAQAQDLIVSNSDQSSNGTAAFLGNGFWALGNSFTTGDHAGGWVASHIRLSIGSTVDSQNINVRARLYTCASDGLRPRTHLVDLTGNDRVSANNWNRYDFPEDFSLAPNTCYVFTLECVSGCANNNLITVNALLGAQENNGTWTGWSLGDKYAARLNPSSGAAWRDAPHNIRPLRMEVYGRNPETIQIEEIRMMSVPGKGPDGDTYGRGDEIRIRVIFNLPVGVHSDDAPGFQFRLDGGEVRTATYTWGSHTKILNFRYTVKAGDLDTDGIFIGRNIPGDNQIWTATDKIRGVGSDSHRLVTLWHPTIGVLSGHKVNGGITHPTITPNSASAWEGSDVIFPVLLSETTAEDVTVDYATSTERGDTAVLDTTAPGGADYTATTGTLTIRAGQIQATYTVPTTADTVDEQDYEVFRVTLSNPSGGELGSSSMAKGAVFDNDDPQTFAHADPAPVAESAASVEFEVGIEPSGKTMSMSWATEDSTAVSGEDYTAASGTLTYLPGESTQRITIPLIDDQIAEGDETFYVRMSDPQNITLASGLDRLTVTIDDDEPTPEVTLTLDPDSIRESDDPHVLGDQSASVVTATQNGVSSRPTTITVSRRPTATGSSR